MKVGCPWWAIPSAMAASRASRSFPSSTVSVCHPKAVVPGRPVLGEGQAGVAVDRHVVVVVEEDEVVEREVARERRRLARDALHQITVRDEREHPEPGRLAEAGGEVLGGDRHPDRVPRALAERAGGRLDTGRVAVLGMAGREAPPLAEALELVERQVVARQVEQRVEQHAAVPRREDEPVAAGPGRVGRVVAQVARPEHVRHRGGAHREARMARFGLLDRVHRQGAEGVDCQLVDVVVRP